MQPHRTKVESDLPTAAPPGVGGPLLPDERDRLLETLDNEECPPQIGPFRTLKILGRGGMGAVLLAEQIEPIRRIVAIKLIKLGLDTREVIARFQAERQVLARLDHPHIAKVLEAGFTDIGRPYFVMEYVPGEPITDFADKHRLNVPERLHLFQQVCEAIAHAHTKAILHRDIKATNVLAYMQDDKPLAKVIDFGIAKALAGDRLADLTLHTSLGQMIGTLEYMSPEQADGSGDIDTRSDVYSLGVLLYELLCGAKPIETAAQTTGSEQELRRLIRDVDPPRPSTRLLAMSQHGTDIAARRKLTLAALHRQLKGELEWIPLKAMRKDRLQRYATAAALADDIGNFLAHRPLIAAPESARYRLRKFLRRNKVLVSAGAAVAIALLLGAIVSSLLAIRTMAALNEAESANRNARAVNEFLAADVLGSADPAITRTRPELTVREALDSAATKLADKFRDQPRTEATVRDSMASAYAALGHPDLALPHAEQALRLARQLLGDDHLDTINFLNNYAIVLASSGRLVEAAELHKEALQRRRRVLGDDHLDTIQSMNNYAGVLRALGRGAEAEPLARQALQKTRVRLGNDHPNTLTSLNNYGTLLESLRRSNDAEPLLKEALERRRHVLGDDHPLTIQSMDNYAFVLASLGRIADAEPLNRQALESRRRILGEDHPDTIQSLNNYARVLWLLGRREEAEPLLRQALAQVRAALGHDHPNTITSLHNYASALQALGRAADAEPLFAELYRAAQTADIPPPVAAQYVARWGPCLVRLERYQDAEHPLNEAHRRLRDTGLSQDRAMSDVLAALAEMCDRTNRPGAAAAWRAELAALQASTRPATSQAR